MRETSISHKLWKRDSFSFSPIWKISCLQHHLMISSFFTTDLQCQFCHVFDFNVCGCLSDFLFFVLVYLSSHYHICLLYSTPLFFRSVLAIGHFLPVRKYQNQTTKLLKKHWWYFDLKVHWIYVSTWKQLSSSVTMSYPFHNRGEVSVFIQVLHVFP